MSLIDRILNRFNLSDTKKKVVRNLAWAVTGKVITLLGSLLVGIFVARYLGPEQYGLMSYVTSFVALFQVFASFGLDNIEIREEAKCEGLGDEKRIPSPECNTILGTAFTLKLIFAAITMALVIATAWIFEADTFTKWMITLYSFSMIMQTFGVIRNYFTSIVWNEYIVKTEISRTIIGAAIKVVLLLLHAPLVWFIAATLFDTVLIASGYLISYNKKIASIRLWTYNPTTARYLLKEAFPLLVSLSAVLIYQRIDQIMVAKMLNNAELGQYTVAVQFTEILFFIPTILAQTIVPILTRLHKENFEEYRKKTQQFVNVTVWLCVLASALVAIIAPWLIKYTFGVAYLPATLPLQILVFKTVAHSLSASAGNMIIIEGTQKWAWIRSVSACFVCVAMNYLFIPRWGVEGTAAASILTYLYAGTLSNIFIPPYWSVLKTQISAILFGWKDLVHVKQLFK